ncbi:Zinc knuckle [Geosmithia morbida]|uniref:Zinc knuckle n=1 Tax=Geosmithia morbida TaxID=1094350 RepID=A0A9P4YSM8_9HYPO|nr:Zinc knuckle [Geosmithia morbida]KAF4121087.1 Zinc knuckle [Geosmithia morbida]
MTGWGPDPHLPTQDAPGWNSRGNDAVDQSGGGNASCSGCGQASHDTDSCPNAVIADSSGYQLVGGEIDTCFGCGETGHRRADCSNAEPMTCNYCKQPGHMIKNCPDKGALVCGNCGEEGHIWRSCEKPRKINRDHVADVDPEVAWAKLKQAASERDVDDAREALQEYVKALDGAPTYKEIQIGLIGNRINLWLIGLDRQLAGAFTNMDLQGNTGKKYSISYRFSEKPCRPREREGWPESREDLLNRLNDAGDTVDSGKQRCYNCGEFGHGSKSCTEPPRERDEEPSLCRNCNGEDHRLRDCPLPRVDKSACRNCGQSGHRATRCGEPVNVDNITCRKCEKTGHLSRDCLEEGGGGGGGCRNCGQAGHFAKECGQPRSMDLVTCRNCEKTGHVSRDCPEPKDWSKVQCKNCQRFGHTHARCKGPSQDAPVDDQGGLDNAGFSGDAGGFNNAARFQNAADFAPSTASTGGNGNAGGW